MEKNFFNNLSKQILDVLPESIHVLKKDLEKTISHSLQQAFAKLNLVTREEYDAQTKVLARTRKKIDALEIKLAELETLLKQRHDD